MYDSEDAAALLNGGAEGTTPPSTPPYRSSCWPRGNGVEGSDGADGRSDDAPLSEHVVSLHALLKAQLSAAHEPSAILADGSGGHGSGGHGSGGQLLPMACELHGELTGTLEPYPHAGPMPSQIHASRAPLAVD
jgi:hypothetical protein